MTAETIGPYRLSRADFIAASVIISFVTGNRAMRIRSWVIIAAAVAVGLNGFISGEWWVAGFAVFFVAYLFVIAPALRSRSKANDVLLGAEPEGIVAETGGMRTLYKWSTVGVTKRTRERLFIMMTPACALVVPARITTAEKLDALARIVAEHRVSREA